MSKINVNFFSKKKCIRSGVLTNFILMLGTFLFLSLPYLDAQAIEETISNSEKPFLDEAVTQLTQIHSKLKLVHGSLSDEYPEQLMTVMYLPPTAKVLELGGNVGRNSCVIASILNDSKNLVTTESNFKIANELRENRDANKLNFHVEASAISKVRLVQGGPFGWLTIPSEVNIKGYFKVRTITFEQVQKKYQIEFDTLVVDCEGALYYILRDDPEILRNINLVIIENDFQTIEQADFVHTLFEENGLQLVYNQALGANANLPCDSFFYQVWKK